MSTSASDWDERSPLLNSDTVTRTKFHKFLLPLCIFVFLFYASLTGGGTIVPQYIQARVELRDNLTQDTTSRDDCSVVNGSTVKHKGGKSSSERSSAILAAAHLAGGIPNILTVFFYGVLSDRIGRKVIMFITLGGLLLSNIVLSLFINFKLPFFVYFIGNFISGASGSVSASIAALFALVADMIPKKKRGLAIAIVEGSVGLGALLSNLMSGWLIQYVDYGVTMIIFSAISVLSIIPIFFIKEPERHAPPVEETNKSSICFTFQQMLISIKNLLLFNRNRTFCLFLIFFSLTIVNISTAGFGTVSILYLKDVPFCWSATNVGNFNAIYVSVAILGGFGSLIFIKDRLSSDNYILLSLASKFITNFLIGIASQFERPANSIIAIAGSVSVIFSALASIIMRAMSVRFVEETERGALYGFLSIGDAISYSLGSSILSSIYSISIGFLRGFVFYLSAGLLLITMFLMTIFRIRSRKLLLHQIQLNHIH